MNTKCTTFALTGTEPGKQFVTAVFLTEDTERDIQRRTQIVFVPVLNERNELVDIARDADDKFVATALDLDALVEGTARELDAQNLIERWLFPLHLTPAFKR